MASVTKHLTLLLLHSGPNVLLGMKKRGFGKGKLNGFGGKIEPGETVLQAAVREMEEESGVAVQDADLRGRLTFTFEASPEKLEVYVFRATQYSGAVCESEEMAPEWFPADAPPLDRMWLDDKHWLPLLLGGRSFVGSFQFRGHDTLLSHTLREVGEGEGLGVDSRDVLVTQVQAGITS